MAAEVVGSAFVRIRAITTGLAKEIESGVKKGAANADVGTSGSKVGDEFAKNAGAKITPGLEKSIKEGLRDKDGEGEKGGRDLSNNFLRGLRNAFTKDGGNTGGIAGDLFSGGFKSALIKLSVTAFPAVLGAASALLQYAASLVAQIGFLATGVVGLGAAGGAALGAIGIAALPLVLAFKAPTQALETFQKALSGVGKQWLEVGAATQSTVLPGLTKALNLSTNLIPVFRAFGREVGSLVGSFADLEARTLFTGDGLERFRGILMGSVPIVQSLLRVGSTLIEVFLDIWRASLPAALDFAATLASITEPLREILRIATLNGSLSDTINEWYLRGKLVVGALIDIVKAIGNILSVGADSSTSFFTTFDKFAERFRTFTESAAGRNKLAKIFEQANAIAHEFNGLITDIVKAISGAVFDGEGGDGIVGFLSLLRDMVPKVSEFFAALTGGGYGSALLDLAKSLGELFKSLDAAGVVGPGLATLTTTLKIFTGIIDTLVSIPGFGVFISHVLGFAGALKVLEQVTGINALGKLTGQFKDLLNPNNPTTLKTLGTSFIDVGKKSVTMATDIVTSFAKMVASAVAATAKMVAQAAIQIAKWVAMAAAATFNAAIIVAGWVASGVTAAASAVTGVVVATASIIAGWAAQAAAATTNAVLIAAAWLIAYGPIIAIGLAVAALVVIVVKNFDTIKTAITTALSFVINFAKSNWPLLLAIITGPFGLIVLAITKNWDTIKDVFAAGVKFVVDKFLGMVEWIVRAAASAFGWVPGIGDDLKKAAKAVETFRDDVNRALGGINDKIVQIKIQQKDSGDFATRGAHAMGGIFRRATDALIGEDGVEALLPITKPWRMKQILGSNPSIAAAIQAAMPQLNSTMSRAGASLGTGNTSTIGASYSAAGGINVTIAAGAIQVNLQNASPEEAFMAGEQVWAGLNAAMAERRAKIEQRTI